LVNIIFYNIYLQNLQIYHSNFTQYTQNLQNLAMKKINYSFNVENFLINEALFVHSLNKYLHYKMNSLPCSKIWHSVTIHINLVQNKPNGSWQSEYYSYLVVTRNLELISGSKIWLFSKLVKIFLKFKGFKICAYFLYSISCCYVIGNFVIFH
jgi:hypothetical protein